MEIRDHHILITGANRGIGKAVAQRFAEDKAHLHIAIRSADENLKEELLKLGAASVQIYHVDLSSRENIQQFLQKINKVEIDILFNNAGQMTGGLLENQSLDDIYSMIQVNVNATIHLTHAILPRMLERKKGKIINHSSVAAMMNFPAGSTYSASKAAVLAFTNSLRAEVKGTGVSTLTLITPGVETKMYQDIPKFFGANFDLSFLTSIPPKKYADMIHEAVIQDLDYLKPSGLTGVSLLVAQHLPKFFEGVVINRFKRQ